MRGVTRGSASVDHDMIGGSALGGVSDSLFSVMGVLTSVPSVVGFSIEVVFVSNLSTKLEKIILKIKDLPLVCWEGLRYGSHPKSSQTYSLKKTNFIKVLNSK